ncbi:MAG: hypothetical protein LRY50_02485, partial [Geovibrio sp.]|nr:hypothetical protein [Geovibrio sp.]
EKGHKMDINTYSNPLNERYASKEMLYLFSPHKKSPHGESFGLLWQSQRRNWGLTSLMSR